MEDYLSPCYAIGLNDREAACFLASSRGFQGEALEWLVNEVITLQQREPGISQKTALEKVYCLLNGLDDFEDGDFKFPSLVVDDILAVWEGAQTLCTILLRKMSRSWN